VTYKLTADQTRCIGAAACLGSSVLQLDSKGKIQVIGDGTVPDAELEAIEDGVAFCPVGALTLSKDST
jgi:ferredoxin